MVGDNRAGGAGSRAARARRVITHRRRASVSLGWSKGPGNMSMYSSYLFERFCLFTYLPFLMYTAIRNPGYFMHLT